MRSTFKFALSAASVALAVIATAWVPAVPNAVNQVYTLQSLSISATANPQNVIDGSASQISYSTTDFSQGDYVTISGSGGSDTWTVQPTNQGYYALSDLVKWNGSNNSTVTYSFSANN